MSRKRVVKEMSGTYYGSQENVISRLIEEVNTLKGQVKELQDRQKLNMDSLQELWDNEYDTRWNNY